MAFSHTLGVTPEELRHGLEVYANDTTRDLLYWSHGYATTLGSVTALATRIGYGEDTIKRIWRGSLPHCTEPFVTALSDLRLQVARQQVDRFAETEITQAIWRCCDRALREGVIVAIVGPSGSSKTATLRQWQASNNHGRSIYVDVPVPCRLRTLANELSRCAGFTSKAHKKGHEMIDMISRSFTSRNVIILDEVRRMLPQGRGNDVSALEFMRRLHDDQGVGLVLAMTYEGREEFSAGRLAGYLEQLVGRIDDSVEIPAAPLTTEAEAITRLYAPDASPELIAAVGEYAAGRYGRWRPTATVLDRAAKVAQATGKPLTLDLWQAALKHRAGLKKWTGTPIKVTS